MDGTEQSPTGEVGAAAPAAGDAASGSDALFAGVGEQELYAAFGASAPPVAPMSENDDDDGDGTSVSTGTEGQPGDAAAASPPAADGASASAPTPASAPAAPTAASLDAYVQNQVQAEIAKREALARAKQTEAQLSRMNDADYGRYMRQYQQQAAQYHSAQEAVAAKFYQEATGDVLAKIPELQKLSPEESQRLDPSKFQTYGEMVSAWADVVAEKRAPKAAEKVAKTMFDAWKAEETARIAKELPHPATFGPFGPGSDEPRFGNASGEELLAWGLSHAPKAK